MESGYRFFKTFIIGTVVAMIPLMVTHQVTNTMLALDDNRDDAAAKQQYEEMLTATSERMDEFQTSILRFGSQADRLEKRLNAMSENEESATHDVERLVSLYDELTKTIKVAEASTKSTAKAVESLNDRTGVLASANDKVLALQRVQSQEVIDLIAQLRRELSPRSGSGEQPPLELTKLE